MIVQNRVTIEDEDGDRYSFEWDDEDGVFYLEDADGTRILGITKEDAVGLIQFFKRFGESA